MSVKIGDFIIRQSDLKTCFKSVKHVNKYSHWNVCIFFWRELKSKHCKTQNWWFLSIVKSDSVYRWKHWLEFVCRETIPRGK